MLPINPKVYVYAAAVVVLGLIIGFLRNHWIQEGLARQRAADASQLEKARVASERKEEEWRQKYETVTQAFTNEVAANAAAPHIQSVRVCRGPASSITLPPAPDAARGPTAITGSLPPGDGLPDEGPDLGYGLEMFARSADAVVAMCRRQNADLQMP